MSFVDNLRGFISKRQPALDQIKSEDQAKLALVFPFLRHLGYDTTDPLEIVPEFTADHGVKKGEKVDVAVLVDGEPAILIECKAPGADFMSHNGQLYRYFSVTKAKFAILTDGLEYWFFSDVDEPNKMDAKPFMSINIFNASDAELKELQRFEKSSFDPSEVAESAEQLKKMSLMKGVIERELSDPSEDFIRLMSREVLVGKMTQARLVEFRGIMQKAIREYLREYLNANLKKAMDRISDDSTEVSETNYDSEELNDDAADAETQEIIKAEGEAVRIIKAVLAKSVKAERISLRPGKSYRTVILDGSTRKRIALLRFGKRKKVMEILTDETLRVSVDELESIYDYADQLREALSKNID